MSNYHLCLNWNEKDENWLYWLQPDDVPFDEKNREHKSLIIAQPSETGEAILNICPDLVVGLERLEQCQRADFEKIFQNSSLITAWQHEQHNPFRALVRVEIPPDKQSEGKWAQIALFKAVYTYLLRAERYRTLDADIAFVYCAWQRYNLIKAQVAKNDKAQQPIIALDYEFAMAYRALAALLEQDTFSYSFHVLWRYRLQGKNADRKGKAYNLSHPLIRERLRVSMVLSKKKTSTQDNQKSNSNLPEVPIDAPLCFRSKLKWRCTHIHPWFTKKRAKSTVRRLIRNWLLPRYSLCSAAYLAIKLTQSKMWWVRFVRFLIAFGLPIVLFVLVAMFTEDSFGFAQNAIALILQGIGPTILFITLLCIDKHSILHILLPRLCGGIFGGYLSLTIAQEAWLLVTFFCSPQGENNTYLLKWPYALLLIVFSILLALIYFINEAFVYTNDWRQALRRASVVLIWAVVVAVSLGAWDCQFGAPILESIDIDQEAEGFQPLVFKPILPGILKRPIPIPALLTFAPLALLIGIMVQIIWEEKPITATVWSLEER